MSAAAVSPLASAPSAASIRAAAARPKVLLVDDETSVLFVIKAMLGKKRYDIHTCESLEDARALRARHTYQLILADLNLREESGLDLLREKPGSTPVMLMSGAFSDSDLLDLAMDEGAASYISKPIELAELLAKTERLIAGSMRAAA